jgi:probable rRNA maturation factor
MPTTSTRRKNKVSVQYAVRRRGVPSAASLRRWAALIPCGATLRIVGTREGRRLNRSFRGKNYATNVLSFPYAKGEGDVILCHPVIAREARARRKPLAAHYAHLVLHGLLHLRGYDHEKKREAERMERAEIRLLARAGFGNPYTLE